MTIPLPEPSAPSLPLNYQGADPNLKLWNPNAAGCWSILFSPIFGAWLVAKNWDALGFPDKARTNRIVAGVFLVIFLVVPFISLIPAASAATKPLGIICLLTWYFSLGKPQATYIKTTFGDAYNRRAWGAPIGLAIALSVAYLAFCFAVGFIMVFTGVIKPT